MPRFNCQPPAGIAKIDAGAVHEWLAERGYAVAGVSVAQDQDRVPTLVVVDADRDPSADVALYAGALSAEQQRVRGLVQTVRAYASLVEANGTPTAAQTQTALRAVIRLLQNVYQEVNTP